MYNLSQKSVYPLPVTLNSQLRILKPLEIQSSKGFVYLYLFLQGANKSI